MYRGIIDFKKSYQLRTDIVKNEKGGLFSGSYSIVARWRNYFSQLLNVHGVNDDRQTEIHKARTSAFDVEMHIEKLKSHKSPGIDQIPTELIQAGVRKKRSKIHKLIN